MTVTPLTIVILGFVLLESTNVIAMYFFPETRYANSIGVFKAWEKSKADPQVHGLVRYLVHWVAGTKLIFLALLLVIVFTSDTTGLVWTGVALAAAVASFFCGSSRRFERWTGEGMLESAGYSRLLGLMIAAMVLILVLATVLTAT